MDYKGCNIAVSVFPDVKGQTYHATYTILRASGSAQTGAVPGGIKSIEDAERIAGLLARLSIDEQFGVRARQP